jgi:hypothetical protein
MPQTAEDSQPPRQPLLSRLKSLYQHIRPTPRLSLFFIAIVAKLLASALSGIGFVVNSPVLLIGGSVVWLIFFALLLAIAIPATDNRLERHLHWLKPTAATIFSILLIVGIIEFAIVFSIGFGGVGIDILGDNTEEVMQAFDNTFDYNDATALCHQAIDSFLDNQNPYAQANIASALIQFDVPLDKLTPLREGRLADVFPYPSTEQLAAIAQEAIDYPSQIPPELESKLGYPAGCFLIPAAFVMTGLGDLRLVYLIIILPVLGYALWKVPSGKRLIVAATLLVSLEFWNSLAAGETGFLCFPFLLLAWILPRKRLWPAAACMGLAVAIKQVAWFFLPFYLILLFRREGPKKTLASLGIIAATFIIFNAPYIIGDPGLWLASVMSPMTDNLFPLGVGIVTLVTGGLIETQSSLAFTIMELVVFAAAVIWYFRYCRRYPNTGPILAVLPLFFAWRSLWPYFYYIDFIVLLAVAVNEYGRQPQLQPVIPEDSPA